MAITIVFDEYNPALAKFKRKVEISKLKSPKGAGSAVVSFCSTLKNAFSRVLGSMRK